jgi:hypothetical protein
MLEFFGKVVANSVVTELRISAKLPLVGRAVLRWPRARIERPSEGFIDLGAIGASRGRFEVRLDLGGGVLLQLVRS